MTTRRWGFARISLAMVALAAIPGLVIGATVVRAQGGADTPHPVHIHTGTCDELGDIVAPLNDVTAVGEGASEGAARATLVQQSVTEVELPLTAILGAPHAINVHESAENIQNYVACGDIGGRVVDGKLAIGLQEINGSDLSGIAVLEADDDDETDITLYLVEEGVIAGVETESVPANGAATDAAAPTATPAPALAATVAPTAVPAAPTVTTIPATTEPVAEEAAVEIRDFSFNPPTIEIAVGDSVAWSNQDGVPHTATANEREVLQSGVIPPDGGSFSQTFDTAGEFPYFCEFHPDMNGTVIVR